MPKVPQDYQLRQLAVGLAAGKPASVLAKALDLEESYVRRAAQNPSAKLASFLEEARLKTHAADLKFRMEMGEMWGLAVNAVREAVSQTKDPRLALDAAKDIFSVHGVDFPRDRKVPEQLSQTNVYMQDTKALDALVSVTDSLREVLPKMPGELKPVMEGSRHIRLSEPTVERELEAVQISQPSEATETPEPIEGAPVDATGSNN
jgi:hypothetical protein